MANALQIDSLKLAEDLEEAAGDPRKTARVISSAVKSVDVSSLATKEDIAQIRADMYKMVVAQTLILITAVIGIVSLL